MRGGCIACLDKKTGLIEAIPALKTGHTNSSGTTSLPCRYVGVWSSIGQTGVRRISLQDDGHYVMDPTVSGGGRSYTGYWAVQGSNMVWRHNHSNSGEPDVNLIQSESDDRFTLHEENGWRTRFELIERIKSTKCAPS